MSDGTQTVVAVSDRGVQPLDLTQVDSCHSLSDILNAADPAGLARFLQAVPELEAQKRVPLVDGRREAIAALANDALRNLPQVSRTKKRMARAARSALTEAFMANSILKQAAAEPGRVAQGALGISRLKRSVLLWRWS